MKPAPAAQPLATPVPPAPAPAPPAAADGKASGPDGKASADRRLELRDRLAVTILLVPFVLLVVQAGALLERREINLALETAAEAREIVERTGANLYRSAIDDVEAAYERFQAGGKFGKIVLTL